MRFFMNRIKMPFNFYGGNKAEQKEQEETIVSFCFLYIISDGSVGTEISDTLPYGVC